MAKTTDQITVDPQGQSMVVDIFDSNSMSVTCYTARAGSSAFTLPVTISTATTFYLTSGGYYSVSAKAGGVEIAGVGGARATVQAAQGVPVTVTPVLDPVEEIASKVAASAAYAAAGFPAAATAAGSLKRYEPSTQLYNGSDSALRLARAAIARARSGGAPFRIFCAGDSITYGAHGDTPLALNCYAGQLAAMLDGALGVPARRGAWWANGDGSFDDPRVAIGAGWTYAAFGAGSGYDPTAVNGIGGGGELRADNTAGGVITFTDYCDTFDVYALAASLGSFTVDVDGAAPVTVNPTGTGGYKQTISAGSLGVHTLTIHPPTVGGQVALFIGAEAYCSGLPGALTSHQGVNGQTTTYWDNGATVGNAYGSDLAWTLYKPDLTFIGLGMNDSRTDADAVAVATYKTHLTNIVTLARVNNSDVIFLAYWQSDAVSQGSMAAYVQAMYQIADSLDVCVLDIGARWPAVATAAAAPYSLVYSDHIHPQARGYHDMAQAIATALVSTLGAPTKPATMPLEQVEVDLMAHGTVVGGWDVTFSTIYPFNGVQFNYSTAQNDSLTVAARLGAGTYTLDLYASKNTDAGIVTVLIDGVSVGTLDFYAASQTPARSPLTGVVIAQPGVHTVTFKVATKNASSTGYVARLSRAVFIRTA